MENTDFSGANLSNSNFVSATLKNTNFSNANLTNAVMSSEYTTVDSTANFTDADISGAQIKFSKEQLYSTKSYKEKKLRGLSFIGGSNYSVYNLEGWDFSSQDLTGSKFSTCYLKSASFTDAIIEGCYFKIYVPTSGSRQGIYWSQIASTKSYKEKNLRGITFEGTDTNSSPLSAGNFVAQDLTNSVFKNMSISKLDFTDAILHNTTFEKVSVIKTDFTRADFRGATINFLAGTIYDSPPTYKNTIMVDGVIKNFGMASSADSFTVRRYTPATSGGEMISAKISESNATVSGGAELKLNTGARLDIVNKKTLTIAENGVLIIDTAASDPTQIYVEALAGLSINGKMNINITEELLPNVEYKFDIILFEDDSKVSNLKDLKPDESLYLTIKGETFNGYWTCVINENKFSILATQVPEPATVAAIFGALALGLAICRRRK